MGLSFMIFGPEVLSYKGLILNATEVFQIVDKFSFKEISKLSQISKPVHSGLKVHSSCLKNTLCKKNQSLHLTHSKVYYGLNFEGARS